jgi:hypothetical protein
MLSETRAEELIRESLHAQADTAPDTADVLTAVHRAAGQRPARGGAFRSDRLLTIAAAGALVILVAVAIPLGLHRSQQVGDGTSKGASSVLMDYHATWLPSGMVSVARSKDLSTNDTTFSEAWWPRADTAKAVTQKYDRVRPSVSMQVTQISVDRMDGGLLHKLGAVDINGKTGEYTSDSPTKAVQFEVDWVAGPDIRISVTAQNFPDIKDVLLRVARSVVYDPSVTTDEPIAFAKIQTPVPLSGVEPTVGPTPIGGGGAQTPINIGPGGISGYGTPSGQAGAGIYLAPASGAPGSIVEPHRTGAVPPVGGLRAPRRPVADQRFLAEQLDRRTGPALRPGRSTDHAGDLGPGAGPLRGQDPNTVGTPVTVHGQPGRYLRQDERVRVFGNPPGNSLTDDTVVVKLGGWWLSVSASGWTQSLPVPTLVGIADNVNVYPQTNLAWLGAGLPTH